MSSLYEVIKERYVKLWIDELVRQKDNMGDVSVYEPFDESDMSYCSQIASKDLLEDIEYLIEEIYDEKVDELKDWINGDKHEI